MLTAFTFFVAEVRKEVETLLKNDFEDFSTLTSGLQVKKKGKKIFIITLIFIILAACAFLAYKNFIAN